LNFLEFSVFCSVVSMKHRFMGRSIIKGRSSLALGAFGEWSFGSLSEVLKVASQDSLKEVFFLRDTAVSRVVGGVRDQDMVDGRGRGSFDKESESFVQSCSGFC
jgi:hypothetical protein